MKFITCKIESTTAERGYVVYIIVDKIEAIRQSVGDNAARLVLTSGEILNVQNNPEDIIMKIRDAKDIEELGDSVPLPS